VNVCDSEPAEE
jgi:hypothetical protein